MGVETVEKNMDHLQYEHCGSESIVKKHPSFCLSGTLAMWESPQSSAFDDKLLSGAAALLCIFHISKCVCACVRLSAAAIIILLIADAAAAADVVAAVTLVAWKRGKVDEYLLGCKRKCVEEVDF